MRSTITLIATAFAAAALTIAACSSSSTPPGNTGNGACSTTSDCAAGFACAYDDSKGCSAKGSCQQSGGGAPVYFACGCDGQGVAFVAPGFTEKPVSSSLPCVDASAPDAGAGVDAGDAATASDGPAADTGSDSAPASDASGSDAGDGATLDASDQ